MSNWDAGSYDDQLARGLSLSGEGAEYFAARRVELVAGRCAGEEFEPRSICELGCGLGTNLVFLARAFPGARLVGLDSSRQMLEGARARLSGLSVELESVEAHRGCGAHDLVFVNGVMHHVEPPDRPAVMATLRDLLRPGGLLALFDNNPFNPGAMWVMRRIPFDRDARPVSAFTLARLARGAGLRGIETRTHFYFPRPLRALRFLEPRLERVPLGAQYVLYARRPPG